MGGRDKGLLAFSGKSLAAILIENLERQSVAIMISANRNLDAYRALGYPIVRDRLDNYQGPLAGIASSMETATTDFILTLPCDGPLLADDYVERFIACHNGTGAAIIVADDGERLQPVHALIRVDLLANLNRYLDGGDRKIERRYESQNYAGADFSDRAEIFENINTPSERKKKKKAL